MIANAIAKKQHKHFGGCFGLLLVQFSKPSLNWGFIPRRKNLILLLLDSTEHDNDLKHSEGNQSFANFASTISFI